MAISGPSSNIMEAKAQYGLATPTIEGPVSILALDGGGVRGLIGIKVLEEVEKRTHMATCDLFKVIAGTSTGSISALALTIPREPGSTKPKFSASDISDLYMKRAQEIFPPIPWWKKPFASAEDLLAPPYGPGLDKVLGEYCGDTPLRDALTEVMVPIFEITESKPWFFQRTISRIDPLLNPLTMKDLARAATAAPTYFNPHQLTFGNRTFAFIDGGMCDNTPSTTAYGIAKRLFQQPDNKHVMLSLGTGICPTVVPDSDNGNFGELTWAPKIVNLLMQGGQQVAERQTELFFSSDRLLRLQPKIASGHKNLNDASPGNLQFLSNLGDELVEENDELLRGFCNQLVGEKRPGMLGSLRWPRWFSQGSL